MKAKPLFISVAPNGARKTTSTVPTIPVTTQTIADEAKRCKEQGAALFHLHIRDDEQQHTLDVNRYREVIHAIKEQIGSDLVIQSTSEEVGKYSAEEQIAMVKELKPEAISLALRELKRASNYIDFFQWVVDQNIFAQFILYSPEEVKEFGQLLSDNKLSITKPFVLFVLGKKHAASNDSSQYAQPEDLKPFLDAYHTYLQPHNAEFAVCAFGGNELDCMLAAINAGGHVRIGFENNHLLADQTPAPHNAALVEQLTQKLPPNRTLQDAHTMRSYFLQK